MTDLMPETLTMLETDFKKMVLSEDMCLLLQPLESLLPRMEDHVFHTVHYIAEADEAFHATPSHMSFFNWPTSPSDCQWIVPGTEMTRAEQMRL